MAPEFATLFHDHQQRIRVRKSSKRNLFEKCQSIGEVKKRFRRLAFLNHPDRGGNSAAMSEIIRQYDEALQTKDHFKGT